MDQSTFPRAAPADDAASPARAWTPEEIQRARQKVLRQLYVLLAIIGVALFGLVDYRYPEVRGESGSTYRIADWGQYIGTDGRWSYFKYFSHATDSAGRQRELNDLRAATEGLALQNGDSVVEVASVDRKFRFGLMHVDLEYNTRYHRAPDGRWVRQ